MYPWEIKKTSRKDSLAPFVFSRTPVESRKTKKAFCQQPWILICKHIKDSRQFKLKDFVVRGLSAVLSKLCGFFRKLLVLCNDG